MTLYDPVFGSLDAVPEYFGLLWMSEVTLPLLGRTKIRVSTVDGPINNAQRQAWQIFIDNTEGYVGKALNSICNHWSQDLDFLAYMATEEFAKGDFVKLLRILRQPHVCVGSVYYGDVLLGLAFTDVDFEREEGVGVSFRGGEVLGVGDAGHGFVV